MARGLIGTGASTQLVRPIQPESAALAAFAAEFAEVR